MKFVFVTLIVVLIVIKNFTSSQYLTNPCPEYFRYESDGYRTYGIIEVPPIQLGINLRINVELSLKATLQNNYYGSLELFGAKKDALESIIYGKNIRYKVNFPVQQPLPKLTKILYNDQLICTGVAESGYVTTIKLEHTLKTESSNVLLSPQNQDVTNKPIVIPQKRPSSEVIGQLEIVVHPNGEISVGPSTIATPSKNPDLPDFQWVLDDMKQKTERPSSTEVTASSTIESTTEISSKSGEATTDTSSTKTSSMSTSTTTTTTMKPAIPGSLDELLADLYGPNLEFIETTSSTTTRTTQSSMEEEADICGKPVPSGNSLVLNGSPIIRGEFPWLVAIYVKKTKNLEFQCGATLVSNQVILTSAHCIHLHTDDILSVNEIVLFVGRNDIDDWTESGYISPKVKKTIVHPDYKAHDPTSVDADIALIVLKQTIKFTQFIRPACLWKGNIKIDEIVEEIGIVVGWGRDREGTITSIPNKIEMPIVSENVCLRSHESYRYLTSNRTFCAGKRDGSGPCNGDSGGPLTIFKNDRWYLRGIVSTSLYDSNTSSCDVRNYVVFTDVAQFLPWILSYL